MSVAEGVDNVDVEVEVSNPGSTAQPSPFVPCTRIGNADWVKRQDNHRWESCVEFELRPGKTLVDDTDLSTSAATERKAGSFCAAILDEMMRPARNGIRVFWLSRCILVVQGYGSDDLDKDSGHRFTQILHIDTWFRSGGVVETPDFCVFCPTRLPSKSVGESVAVADAVFTLIGGWTPWYHIKIWTRRTLRPCSVSTVAIKQIVAAARPGGEQRDVLFDYHGLSDDQWREVFECLHPSIGLTVTDYMADSGNNCFSCLLEAIRRGYGPRRLTVRCGDYADKQMEVLGSALSERMCVVRDLTISASQHCNEDAIRALLPALATPTTGLQKLEVVYHSGLSTDWESIWNVAATNPALSTVRVFCGWSLPFFARPHRNVDPVLAIEAAVRSNRRLTAVSITQREGAADVTPEYVKKVLPLLQSNRIYSLTGDVKECFDASWRLRLFAASLLRLCGPKHLDVGTSLWFVAKLLRGNPDLLESCSRVSDVLHRLWGDHMRAAAFHLERVAHLELRMAESGTEIPKKQPHPQSAD